MSRTSGLLTVGTLALAATFPIGVAHTVNAATTNPTPKACALLTTADFAKAGVSVKVGPPREPSANQCYMVKLITADKTPRRTLPCGSSRMFV